MSTAGAGGARTARLPRRFYERATVERAGAGQGWTVLLDGRPVRTPAKNPLVLPTSALAQALAGEWDAQGERIDPDSMPLTKAANTALDRVRGRKEAVAGEIAAYAESDLLCYRAETPEGLVAAQCEKWDPVLAWFEAERDTKLVLAAGVMPTNQPEESLAAIRSDVEEFDAFALTAMHAITTLTGSVLLALAHAHGRLTMEEAWDAAHVDEDWQISQWGEDAQATARRAARRVEFDAAVRLLALVRSD